MLVVVPKLLADLGGVRVLLELFNFEILQSPKSLVNFFWQRFTVKLNDLAIHPKLDPAEVLGRQGPQLVERVEFFFDDFDTTKVSFQLAKELLSVVASPCLVNGLEDLFLQLLSPLARLQILAQLLVLLDILNVLREIGLHLAEVSLELTGQLLQVLNAVALLHLDLHRPCKGLPDLYHVFLVLAEKVLVKHVNFVGDALDQSLDFKRLVRKHLDELLGFCDLFNVQVVLVLNNAEHVVNFVFNLLLALLDLALNLLKQDLVHFGEFLLEALLEVVDAHDNRPHEEFVLEEKLVDFLLFALVLLQQILVLVHL